MRPVLLLALAATIYGCGAPSTPADNLKMACDAVDSLNNDWKTQGIVQLAIVQRDPNATNHIINKAQECAYEENYRLASFNDTALYKLIDRANSLFIKKSMDAGSARIFIKKLTDKKVADSLMTLISKTEGICVVPLSTDTPANR